MFLIIIIFLYVFLNLVLLVDNICFFFNNYFLKKGINSVMCVCFKVMFIFNKCCFFFIGSNLLFVKEIVFVLLYFKYIWYNCIYIYILNRVVN